MTLEEFDELFDAFQVSRSIWRHIRLTPYPRKTTDCERSARACRGRSAASAPASGYGGSP